jgi:hypothetical protein
MPACALLFGVFLLPELFASPAVGVGTDEPDSVALVGGSDVVRSQHTPSCVIPHLGKMTEDSGKSSSNKQR